MASAPPPRGYRQSYVEKDRCVRNSTQVKIPGVDVMQGFTMSKTEFEDVFLRTADSLDTNQPDQNRPPLAESTADNRSRRPPRQRKRPDQTAPKQPSAPAKPFRAPPSKMLQPELGGADEAVEYADVCRKHAAALQRAEPPDYDAAGEYFEKAVDARAKFGLFCTPENADAHVEYAQNLSKRGLTPEAEYHLRSAADIYRMLDARSARKYGDVLLYMAVVIDRQGRLAEAENFYRSALAVYRANKLSNDNVRVAIDSLSNNLRAQGRSDEVDVVVRRHFLGALE
eukprot:GFKZ01004177.1.p2 GENE.GFKZ01004177.1~~GFKZ01004177.1.p2  ORF type:complete len:295 (+),score=56.62 GFKZ01004177.1:35-886(+)